MEDAIVVGLLAIGAVMRGLIVAAWNSDKDNPVDALLDAQQTKFRHVDGMFLFDGPLTPEEVQYFKELWFHHHSEGLRWMP